MKVKSNDEVKIISGNYKGKIGKIIKAFPKTNKVLVEGVNKVKKHKKPTSQDDGGIVEKLLPINVSNVALVFGKEKTVAKVGYKFVDKKKIRIDKRTLKSID